ncbi:ferredoxin reductase domain-containing protein [Novipirellula artificiosorum]|uniref:Ferredoxin--NADP reductase n=1 Tax=Novipirellula artificiosorum TaxID=2528016 RepID=A0A5C6D3V8_9BACT|nr:ferredoxin-NADP reductase [Novipirellula artificiosorum]TWU31572.1 Ferredoxin--NADP reductase [Novipirellula artificiosorum]
MRLQDYDTKTRYQAKVLRSERLTPAESRHEVRDITVEIEGPDFNVEVGRNIGVLAPGRAELGQEYHLRLYGVADLPGTSDDGSKQVTICVRRCTYIDQYSGEEYPGVASNYLCDLSPGDALTITGPYGQPFEVPADNEANLILICAGTGIAPFRAFVKHLYKEQPDFKGCIKLFHGGQTGLDLLYRNDEKDDFSLYYDRDTFEAIDALSKRPGWSDASGWGHAMLDRAEELSSLLNDSKTYVYVAGVERIRDELDEVLSSVVGPHQNWAQRKAELQSEGRWTELLY